jgi:hypothetical protein
MSNALPNPSTDDLVRHYGLVVSGAYLYMSVIGASYYLCLFGYFGLNAFDWWDVSDFFLAAFREPIVLPFSFMALWIAWLLANPDASNRHLIENWPRVARWTGTTWMYEKGLVWRLPAWAALSFATFWFLLVIYGLAAHDAAAARAGRAPAISWRTQDGSLHRGHLLATTSQYVAVIDASAKPARLVMVPLANADEFTLCGERRRLMPALRGDASPCASAQ